MEVHTGPSSAIGAVARLGFFLAAASALGGCSWSTDRNEYPIPEQRPFEVTGSSITQGQDQVPRNVEIRIGFSAWPDQATLSGTSASLTAGMASTPSSYRVNLVRCEAVIRPVEPLQGSLTYVLKVQEPLTSLQGETLAEPFQLTFTTSDQLDPDPPAPTVDPTEVADRVFAPHCGCCHASGGQYSSVLVLDPLTIVDLHSNQVPSAVLVKPGVHSASYLMHKVLGLPSIEGDAMPPPYSELACTVPWPESRTCDAVDELVGLLATWIDGLEP